MHGTAERELFYGTSGPPDARVVLVGESWGAEEEKVAQPFVGTSGTELNRMLAEAGIQRADVFCTNIVAERPHGNEMWRFFHPADNPSGNPLGGLDPRDNVRHELQRLYRQLAAHPRSIVIAAGNYALWALTGKHGKEKKRSSNNRPIPREQQPFEPTGITSQRGSMWYVEGYRELGWQEGRLATPCLPIIHPAAIMRDWSQRAVTVHDLKARVPMALRGDWRPSPAPIIWAPPTFEQAKTRLEHWLRMADGGTVVRIAEDIETARQTIITCMGFSDSRNFAMSLPLVRRTEGGLDSFWTADEEWTLSNLIRQLNTHPNIRIEGQNFIYDTQYIQVEYGVTPRLDWDTMLAQNVAFPGTPKDLGYLASLFCRYHWYWKDDSKDWDVKRSLEQLLQYNALDALRTWEIAEAQRQMIPLLGLTEQMKLKMQVNDLCLRMTNRGVRFDRKRQGEMSVMLSEAYNDLARELLVIAPQEWVDPDYEEHVKKGWYDARNGKRPKMTYWYRSEKQTKELLINQCGFPVIRDRKTGRPTSGEEARHEWLKRVPEFTGLLKRLGLAESVENTATVLRSATEPNGRIKCSFNPGGTETHRLSSSKNAFGRGMNGQNLTKGKEDD